MEKRGRVYPVLAFLIFVLTASVLLMACNTGPEPTEASSSEVAALRQQVEELAGKLQHTERAALTGQVIGTIYHIDAAGFHRIDEGLTAREMDSRWAGTVGNVVAVTEATAWPEDLRPHAAAFMDAAKALQQALAAEDLQAAASAASKAHDTQHALSHAVYGWLSGEGHSGDANSGSGGHGPTPATGDQVPEGAVRFPLELRENGAPVGGPATHQATQGDTVAFVVQPGVAGEFHVHGYDLEWQLTAGQETVAWFEANLTGRFPLEVHVAGEAEGVAAGYLEVHP